MTNSRKRRVGLYVYIACLVVLGTGSAATRDAGDDDRPPGAASGAASPGESRQRTNIDIDSDSLFGFTEGADTGDAGEQEVSKEFTFRRRMGVAGYDAIQSFLKYEYSARDDLKLGIGLGVDYYRLSDVQFSTDDDAAAPFLPRRSLVAIFSGEVKYRILERGPNPIGLSISFEPEWRRAVSGRGFDTSLLQFQTKLMADAALIPERLLVAANISWEPQVTWPSSGGTERDTNVEASAALSVRVRDKVFLGGEIRYLSSFAGLSFQKAPDYGIFIGPTMYAKLSGQAYLAAAWSTRVGGVVRGQPESVPDFGNVPDSAEHHHVRVRIGFNF